MTNPSDPAAAPADKIIMQGVHLELTAALQNVIRDKFSVLLRHNPRIVRIHVRLTQEQSRGRTHLYSATSQIEISGPDLVATAKGDDAYSVLDSLVEKLDEQIRERHERRTDKRHQSSVDDLGANAESAAADR